MANIETVGVRLVVENFSSFNTQLGKVDTELKRKQKDAGGAAGAIGGLGTAFSGVLGPLGMFAGALANVAQIAAGIIAARIFETLTTGIFEFGKAALFAAGRADELQLISRFLGEQAGYSAEQIDEYTQNIIKAGIRTGEASQTVALFVRYGLDLSKMWDLVRVAQGGATIAAEESTEALHWLLRGIISGQTRLLRNRGIIIDARAEMARFAASIDKVSSELSDTERATALLNAALRVGAPVAKLYEVAMTKWTKQLRSTPRYIYELTVQLGAPFDKVMESAVFAMNDFIEALTRAASAGGWLRGIIENLASTMVRLIAPVVALVQVLTSFILVQEPLFTRLGSAIGEVTGKIRGLRAEVGEGIELEQITEGLSELAEKTARIMDDLARNITRMWDDFGRRLARSSEDWGRRQARSSEDWGRRRARDEEDRNRDKERDLEDHLRRLAEMRQSWDEKDYRRRVRQVRRDMQRWQFYYGRDLADYNAILAGAKTEEERIRIQSWIDQLNVEDEGHREEAQDELDALAQEKLDHERRIAMEKEEFVRRRALADEDRRIRLASEDEDRRIRLAREEEDRQIRLAREQADAGLREQRLRDDADKRIALLAEESEEQDTWADEMAGRMGGATSAIEGFSGTMVAAVDEWVVKFEELAKTWTEMDWAGLGEDLSTIADTLGWLRDTFSSLTEKLTIATERFDEFGDPLLSLDILIGGNIRWLRRWGEVWAGVVDVISTLITEGPRPALDKLIDYLPEWGTALFDALLGFQDMTMGFIGTFWETVLGAIDTLVFLITGEIPGLRKRFQEWFYPLGEGLMQGMVDGIESMGEHLFSVLDRIVGHAVSLAERILNIGSPSMVFYNIGQEMVRGMTEGLKSLEAMPAIQVAHIAAGAMQAASGASTSTNNYNLTVNTTAPSEPIVHDFYLMRARTG